MKIKRTLREIRKCASDYVFLMPSWIIISIFFLIPVFWSLYLSFFRGTLINMTETFVWLENYKRLIHDPLFWKALGNTAYFTGVSVPLQIMVSLIVAVLIHQIVRLKVFFRAVYFLPVVTSLVSVTIIWIWLFNGSFGLINYILRSLGLEKGIVNLLNLRGGHIFWLNEPKLAMLSIILITLWKDIGYKTVLFLAGLQGIPRHLYEAAEIDGASWGKRFRYITIPMLKPTTLFVAVISFIASFQVFIQMFVIGGAEGRPLRSTLSIVSYIYRTGFFIHEIGYASAIAYALFIIVFICSLIQFKYFSTDIEY